MRIFVIHDFKEIVFNLLYKANIYSFTTVFIINSDKIELNLEEDPILTRTARI